MPTSLLDCVHLPDGGVPCSPHLQLFNGSYTNIMKQFGVDELRKRVEKFFSRVRVSLGWPHSPSSLH